MEFQRARSDEQREMRRRTILTTTASMLEEMPVAEVSLNELSRRVGLAKSNVLRYFESREAILLELLDTQMRQWSHALDKALAANDSNLEDRIAFVAGEFARSMVDRPVLCDLISAQTSVLERNISTDVALRHKRATAESVSRVIDAIRRVLPELTTEHAYEAAAYGLFLTSAAWPHSSPSEALQAAYAADPTVAATQMRFDDVVDRGTQLIIKGLLAQPLSERSAK